VREGLNMEIEGFDLWIFFSLVLVPGWLAQYRIPGKHGGPDDGRRFLR
jgi:hypothetical protein